MSGSSDKTIKIWNIEDGSVKRTLIGHISEVFSLRVLVNGDLFSIGNGLKIWDVETGIVKKEFKAKSINMNFSLQELKNGDIVSATCDEITVWS